MDVLSYRSYANMRQYLEQHPDEYPDSEMADTVRDIQNKVGLELVLADMDSMRASS